MVATRRGHTEHATVLSPQDKLRCAYWHLIGGIAQHIIAGMYGINQGRVGEAVSDVRKALNWKDDE